jgi:heme exporter protein C
MLVLSQWFVWSYAPVERQMGLVQKIFYLHLPLAWWGFVSFFLVFVWSILFLWRQKEVYDLVAGAAAEIGVLFCSLVLITGMLWAKASWNTWWTWEPRLSTTLVMWFVYCGYLILRKSFGTEQKHKKFCAVLGILGFLDVPLVFLSARLWRSIHPTVMASREGGLPAEMWLTVLVCLVAWGGLFLSLLLLRYDQLKISAKLDRLISSG